MTERSRRSGHEAFELHFTSPNYERLRSKLIRMFARRGCAIPEDLADETISRVSYRIHEIAETYEGDPARYFFGVARNVYLEHVRGPRSVPLEEVVGTSHTTMFETEPDEEALNLLDTCLQRLDVQDRDLILEYYRHNKGLKIDIRKRLADQLGIGLNALRIKVYRIRRQLQECLSRFLNGSTKSSRGREMESPETS